MPQEISVINGGNKALQFVYNAKGEKLAKKRLTNGSGNPVTETVYYNNGMQYTENASGASIDFFAHEEGRATSNGSGGFNMEYQIKDHLGNLRLAFTDANNNHKIDNNSSEIIQENNYYAFGLNHKYTTPPNQTGPVNKYQYNGKELQDEYGIDLLDYGARMYDATICRWHVVDPLAVMRHNLSPYNYVQNNPINRIDPTGAIDELIGRANISMTSGGSWANDYASVYENFTIMQGSKFDQRYGTSGYLERSLFAIQYMNESEGKETYLWNPRMGKEKARQTNDKNTFITYEGGWKRTNANKNNYVTNEWIMKTGNALTVFGGTLGSLESTVISGDKWLGKNGKFYSTNWGGNQYTGSRSGAFKAAGMYKMAGRANVGATLILGGIAISNGYTKDGNQIGYHTNRAGAEVTGGLIGSFAGAEAGAAIGAGIGVWFGGAGAIPGAVIGGFAGAIIGSFTGSTIGGASVDYYYNK